MRATWTDYSFLPDCTDYSKNYSGIISAGLFWNNSVFVSHIYSADEASVKPLDVVIKGLDIILSLMNEEILKVKEAIEECLD